jgi:hypothetical protein
MRSFHVNPILHYSFNLLVLNTILPLILIVMKPVFQQRLHYRQIKIKHLEAIFIKDEKYHTYHKTNFYIKN